MVKITVIPLVFVAFFLWWSNHTTKTPSSVKENQVVDLVWDSPLYTEEKGLTIIKIAFTTKTPDPTKVTVTPTLPAPWQYLRKEIGPKGDGYIEIAYLTGSPTGYMIKSQEKIASLKFPAAGDLRIDSKKTSLMTKAGKQYPLSIKVNEQ